MNAADPSLVIQPRNTKGSNENIPLLEKGELDIALVAGEPAYEAFMGIGRPATRLKILTAIYSSPGMFVVRADSPYKTIRDLVGQPGRVRRARFGSADPVALHARRSRPEAGRGFSRRSISTAPATGRRWCWTDGSRRCGAPASAGPGSRRWRKAPAARRFIAPDADEIARIRAKHNYLKPLTVPAGSYPNQTTPIHSVGSWSFVLARETLPDDVAYRLARTLHGVEGAFCQKLAQACETTAANTVAAAPDVALIHPGVLKYFREIGVVK